MGDPSVVTLPEGTEYVLDETATGEFRVANAYEGEIEYFPGRPDSAGFGLEPVDDVARIDVSGLPK